MLAAYGLNRLPIWNTEGGLDVVNTGISPTSAAGFVARSLVLQWGLGMKTSCWYAYDTGRYTQYEGLTLGYHNGSGDATRLDPAGRAYRQVGGVYRCLAHRLAATRPWCHAGSEGAFSCIADRLAGLGCRLGRGPGRTAVLAVP